MFLGLRQGFKEDYQMHYHYPSSDASYLQERKNSLFWILIYLLKVDSALKTLCSSGRDVQKMESLHVRWQIEEPTI